MAGGGGFLSLNCRHVDAFHTRRARGGQRGSGAAGGVAVKGDDDEPAMDQSTPGDGHGQLDSSFALDRGREKQESLKSEHLQEERFHYRRFTGSVNSNRLRHIS